jgi:hypothetical protein
MASLTKFTELLKKMQSVKLSESKDNIGEKETKIKLLKTIFCLGAVSDNNGDKLFCLLLGTTLCNYYIILNKLKKKRVSKGGDGTDSVDDDDNKNIAAIALASAYTQVQLSGRSNTSLVRSRAQEIEERIDELNALTRLNQAELSLRRTELQLNAMEDEARIQEIANKRVINLLSSRVGAGTYLNVCCQSTTSCVVCFSLIQTAELISSNIGNNVTRGISNIAGSLTPEVVTKMATDASTFAQNTGSWLSSTYDYMVRNVPQNITENIHITPEDIAAASSIKNYINQLILSNQTIISNFATRTDVQLSCAIGALTCCCLLNGEYKQARDDQRTAALTYSGTFANSAKVEELRYNGVASIVNAGISAIVPGVGRSSTPRRSRSPVTQRMHRQGQGTIPSQGLTRRRRHRRSRSRSSSS